MITSWEMFTLGFLLFSESSINLQTWYLNKNKLTIVKIFCRSLMWGARDGAVVRALASHQCGPGSNPVVNAKCGLSLLLFLSFAPKGFSLGTPVFPSPQKPTFPNSKSTRNQVDEEALCGCATSKSLFILILCVT